MAVETNRDKKTKVQVNKAKMMPADVAKAIAALSQEEREALLDAIMMQEDF
jgi:hypothetical protein